MRTERERQSGFDRALSPRREVSYGFRLKAADALGSEMHREWLFCYLCGSSLPREAKPEYERRWKRRVKVSPWT